jgi:titin
MKKGAFGTPSQGFAGIGLGSDGNLIQGNYIGTDKTGTVALGNNYGISGGSNETIGGSVPGAGNVISGNTNGWGIDLSGSQNLVAGNLIGTSATGLAALGHGDHGGILLGSAADYNTIGGTTPLARNIISGNGGNKVVITGGQHNLIEGNYIGTDITGTRVFGNQNGGIDIQSGDYNTIGGNTPAARNVISGNGSDGGGFGSFRAGGPLLMGTSSKAITSGPISAARSLSGTTTESCWRAMSMITPSAVRCLAKATSFPGGRGQSIS